jgi:Chaperone of endosialidase
MISIKQILRVCALSTVLLDAAGIAVAQSNTAYGTGALQNNTSGTDNSAFGYNALFTNNTGFWNTAVGATALNNNTAGAENTAIGVFALYGNTTGGENTAVGTGAGGSTTGYNNTATGWGALTCNTMGYDDTAIGYGALDGGNDCGSGGPLTTGNFNIGVGYNAGTNIIAGSNNIEIGGAGSSDESNTIRIGTQGTQKATYIAGISGALVNGATVVINSKGRLGVVKSSARYKRDIHPLNERSARLWQLRPVTFRYKEDPQGERQYGLIAEQVAKVYPELVVRGDKGEVESVQYYELIPLMLNEMQHQQAALTALKAQNAALRARLERLEGTSKTLASR